MKPLFLQENYELQRFKEKWWKPQQCQVNKKYIFLKVSRENRDSKINIMLNQPKTKSGV